MVQGSSLSSEIHCTLIFVEGTSSGVIYTAKMGYYFKNYIDVSISFFCLFKTLLLLSDNEDLISIVALSLEKYSVRLHLQSDY